jgi:hypothetical protein
MFGLSLRKSKPSQATAPKTTAPLPTQEPLRDGLSDGLTDPLTSAPPATATPTTTTPDAGDKKKKKTDPADSRTLGQKIEDMSGVGHMLKYDSYIKRKWTEAEQAAQKMKPEDAMTAHRGPFMAFCKQEYSTENADFYWAYTRKLMKPAQLHAQFLGPAAPQEINVARKLYAPGLEGRPEQNDWEGILTTVNTNLSDTLSRFVFTEPAIRSVFRRIHQLTPPAKFMGGYTMAERWKEGLF